MRSQKFILPKLSLQNADPSYRQRINKLRRVINRIKTSPIKHEKYQKEIFQIWKEFGENYLISPDIMEAFLSFRSYYCDNFMKQIAIYHFYYPNKYADYRQSIVKKLRSPHLDIDHTWKMYELSINNFPPVNIQRIYKEIKSFYANLNSIKSNIYAWFYLLMERNDEEFFIINVEYRLYKEFSNKTLWKLYIKYWKQRNVEEMLHLYSKYCRLFLKDNLMKKKYEKELRKYGRPFAVSFKNTFTFEIYDQNALDTSFKKQISYENDVIYDTKMDAIAINANVKAYPFRKALMDYILRNANLLIQHKLQKMCKSFKTKYPNFICYKLYHDSSLADKPYKPYSTCINIRHLKSLHLKNISIATVLNTNWYMGYNKYMLSSFIPRLTQCTAKYIYIHRQNLFYEDLKFLIGHGNVLDLELYDVIIHEQDKSKVSLEKILELLPMIKELSYTSSYNPPNTLYTTPKTCENLLKISFKNKIESLNLSYFSIENFESNLFFEFLKKNISSKCGIWIYIKLQNHNNMEEENQRIYEAYNSIKTCLTNSISSLWNQDEKPSFICSHLW